MTQQSFMEHYNPCRQQTVDEAMIAYKGRLSYVQYLPAKPIKCGIKLWMRCDSESAYLHEYEVYLGRQQNSVHGLAHDVVTKLCQSIAGHNHHLYCDNYFTSVPLFKELLQMKIYATGTVRPNKRGLPPEVKRPPRMVRGQHRSFQMGDSNLVATVWQDNKPVRVLSTNSRPDITYEINRRQGQDSIEVSQPENVFLYNKYMNGVDKHDQLCMQYGVERSSVKAWKYLLWFFVSSCIVNAYILYTKTSRWRTKKNYSHIDFRLEVAHGLIAGFHAWKCKSLSPQDVGPVA